MCARVCVCVCAEQPKAHAEPSLSFDALFLLRLQSPFLSLLTLTVIAAVAVTDILILSLLPLPIAVAVAVTATHLTACLVTRPAHVPNGLCITHEGHLQAYHASHSRSATTAPQQPHDATQQDQTVWQGKSKLHMSAAK